MSTPEELVTQYFELQQKVHEHFGYVEDWVTIPLDDQRRWYWHLTGEGSGDEVWYSSSRENMQAWVLAGDWDEPGIDSHDCYTALIYTQRHLPRWVYRAGDMTMVCADTQTDGNKYLMIFDNAKEVA